MCDQSDLWHPHLLAVWGDCSTPLNAVASSINAQWLLHTCGCAWYSRSLECRSLFILLMRGRLGFDIHLSHTAYPQNRPSMFFPEKFLQGMLTLKNLTKIRNKSTAKSADFGEYFKCDHTWVVDSQVSIPSLWSVTACFSSNFAFALYLNYQFLPLLFICLPHFLVCIFYYITMIRCFFCCYLGPPPASLFVITSGIFFVTYFK